MTAARLLLAAMACAGCTMPLDVPPPCEWDTLGPPVTNVWGRPVLATGTWEECGAVLVGDSVCNGPPDGGLVVQPGESFWHVTRGWNLTEPERCDVIVTDVP
jgi:hypothetical protein